MSTKLEIAYEGETFKIEINDDLDMVFLDYDLEYDQAALEFGYPATPAIALFREWRNSPTDQIIEHFGLSRRVVVLLAADWAEHVFPIFHERFKYDQWIHEALVVARFHDNSWSSQQSAESAWYNAMKAANHAVGSTVLEGALYAANAARDAVHSAFAGRDWKNLVHSVSYYALHAAAFEATNRVATTDFPGSVAYKAEQDWQIRHALKVLEYTRGERVSWPEVSP